jgi:hypothetical protein
VHKRHAVSPDLATGCGGSKLYVPAGLTLKEIAPVNHCVRIVGPQSHSVRGDGKEENFSATARN